MNEIVQHVRLGFHCRAHMWKILVCTFAKYAHINPNKSNIYALEFQHRKKKWYERNKCAIAFARGIFCEFPEIGSRAEFKNPQHRHNITRLPYKIIS